MLLYATTKRYYTEYSYQGTVLKTKNIVRRLSLGSAFSISPDREPLFLPPFAWVVPPWATGEAKYHGACPWLYCPKPTQIKELIWSVHRGFSWRCGLTTAAAVSVSPFWVGYVFCLEHGRFAGWPPRLLHADGSECSWSYEGISSRTRGVSSWFVQRGAKFRINITAYSEPEIHKYAFWFGVRSS